MSISLDQLNAMSINEFEAEFGDIAEHSPWVAKIAANLRPFASKQDMITAFCNTLSAANHQTQLALINAHPDLAGKATLSDDSANEQQGAGLNSLSESELASFTKLNQAYKKKFNFPFIFAVKGATKHQILDGFKQRIQNNNDQEFKAAIENIFKIFGFRITDQVEDQAK